MKIQVVKSETRSDSQNFTPPNLLYKRGLSAYASGSEAKPFLQIAAQKGSVPASLFLAAQLWSDARADGSPVSKQRSIDEALYILGGLSPNNAYFVTNENIARYVCSVHDPTGGHAFKCFLRTLLAGDLKRNSSSALHRSFFRSHLMEVFLLPLIYQFLRPRRTPNPTEPSQSSILGPHHIALKSSQHILPIVFQEFSQSWSLEFLFGDADALSLFRLVDTTLLRTLRVSDKSISCLQPIVGTDTSSMDWLNLSGCLSLSDMSPISMLDTRRLQQLDLSHTSVQDLSFLSSMDTMMLTRLDLSHTNVSDLSPIASGSCGALRVLDFSCTPVSNLAPLAAARVSNLEYLFMNESQVNDLSPLNQLDLSTFVAIFIHNTPAAVALTAQTPTTDLSDKLVSLLRFP